MKVRIRSALILGLLVIAFASSSALAQEEGGGIREGTTITMQNWQNYKPYLPEGMQLFFEGTRFYKFPSDIQMVVGPTHHYEPPKTFLEYTRKYADQVGIKDDSDGRHVLTGYVAGWPFPHPDEPMKGWKILVNLWYGYNPAIFCTPHSHLYFRDRFRNATDETFVVVYRKLDHIGDAGYPITDPNSAGVQFVEYLQITQPEQARYTGQVTLYYSDFTKEEDLFLFVPSLRRSLRLSSAARCSPVIGSDYTQDEARPTLFNTTPARFDATLLREQQILGMTVSDAKDYGNIANFYPDILFPKPAVGKFELRPTFVLDTRRIKSQQKGYCYGKKIMWIDKETYATVWEDLYDDAMKLWKNAYVYAIAAPIPGEGIQGFSWQLFSVMFDQTADHLSMYTNGYPPSKTNQDCTNYDGEDYTNINRYSKVSGLSEIMR